MTPRVRNKRRRLLRLNNERRLMREWYPSCQMSLYLRCDRYQRIALREDAMIRRGMVLMFGQWGKLLNEVDDDQLTQIRQDGGIFG